MSRRLILLLLVLIALSLCFSYALRFGLMEDGQWVGVCAEQAQLWECQLRSALGLLIHFRVFAWLALGLAVPALFIAQRTGWILAALAILIAIPALILYTASLAVFALVLASLRLVRQSAGTSPAVI